MNAVQLIRQQIADAHALQEATIAGVSKTVLHFKKTGKALPVGVAYAHSVISEDIIVSTMLAHRKALSEGSDTTGLSQPMPSFSEWDGYEKWVSGVKIDLPTFQKFAQKVYKATDDYIATLEEKDMDGEIDLPGFGKYTLAHILTNFVLLHIASLTGEISAAKGIQGLKGYSF